MQNKNKKEVDMEQYRGRDGINEHRTMMKKKSDVVIVGVKLNASSRELLTWTLAKFTNSGDRVIALHVAHCSSATKHSLPFSSEAQADNGNEQNNEAFNSVIGVYEGFCSIKKIDLQLRTIKGSSVRKALVEEAQSHNAARLILGTTSSRQLPLGSSFSLVKYCSKRLPYTCSVLVIQHGRVIYEKAGTLPRLDDNLGVRTMTGQCTTSGSCKGHSHQLVQARSTDVSERQMRERTWPKWQRRHSSYSSPSKTFVDSSLHVLHPFKYVPPQQMQGFRMCEMASQTSCADPIGQHQKEFYKCLRETQKHADEASSKVVRSCTELSRPINGYCSTGTPSGWPFLHQSIASTKLENVQTKARRMSVVEWALQLPERSEEVLQQDTKNAGGQQRKGMANRKQTSQYQCNSIDQFRVTIPKTGNYVVASQNNPVMDFQFTELKAATNDFSTADLVGRGGCSQVYRGVLSDGRTVAVKRLNASAPDSEQAFLTEIEIISHLKHGNIVQLIGYCIHQQNYLLVYNFASEGSLEQRLHHANDKGSTVLPWDVRYKVAVGVAEALRYMHDSCTRPVIHRDIKSSNILLLSDLKPQLTDFGLAKWAPSTSSHITCSDVVGTFGYIAPEYFMYGKVNEKTDVYSFGVVLLELITGRHPIGSGKSKGQGNLVLWARPLLEEEASTFQLVDPKLEGVYDANQLRNMRSAAALCLQQSPYARPRIGRILKLLTGECQALEVEQDYTRREPDEGIDEPGYGESDIRTHLTLALLGLDDDATSQMGSDSGTTFTQSSKLMEEYLQRRYNRSSSFE